MTHLQCMQDHLACACKRGALEARSQVCHFYTARNRAYSVGNLAEISYLKRMGNWQHLGVAVDGGVGGWAVSGVDHVECANIAQVARRQRQDGGRRLPQHQVHLLGRLTRSH